VAVSRIARLWLVTSSRSAADYAEQAPEGWASGDGTEGRAGTCTFAGRAGLWSRSGGARHHPVLRGEDQDGSGGYGGFQSADQASLMPRIVLMLSGMGTTISPASLAQAAAR
jgi:hypothetical protein